MSRDSRLRLAEMGRSGELGAGPSILSKGSLALCPRASPIGFSTTVPLTMKLLELTLSVVGTARAGGAGRIPSEPKVRVGVYRLEQTRSVSPLTLM